MRDRKINLSSSDLKKWGIFLLFMLALVVVFLVLARPGGETEAREKLQQANVLNLEAKTIALQTQEPQDLANLDLSSEALRKAQNLLIESDFEGALKESEKAIKHALKVIPEPGQEPPQAKIRIDEMLNDPEIKKANAFDFELAKRKSSVEVEDLIRTNFESVCKLYFANGMDVVIMPSSQVRFQQTLSGTGQDAILYLESGTLTLKTLDLPGNRLFNMFTDTGQLHLFPNTDAEIIYRSTTRETEVRVKGGRVEVEVEPKSLRVLANQKLVFTAGGVTNILTDLIPAPDLIAPANFATYDANINMIATVVLQWNPVPNATHYHLQVSSDPFFTQVTRDKDRFAGEKLEFYDLSVGTYFWRVSSIGHKFNEGLSSQIRQFTINPPKKVNDGQPVDSKPPYLDDIKVMVQGNIVIIHGKTERDATVWINDEKAILDDYTGSFIHTISFPGKGIYSINVVSLDRAGNRNFKERSVEIKD